MVLCVCLMRLCVALICDQRFFEKEGVAICIETNTGGLIYWSMCMCSPWPIAGRFPCVPSKNFNVAVSSFS